MIYHVTIGTRTVAVELDGAHVTVDGRRFETDLGPADGGAVRSLLVDGASRRVAAYRREAGRWDLHLGGRRVRAEVVDERTRAIRAMTAGSAPSVGHHKVVAPMPGMVVRVEVAEGDTVSGGQGVVIVEAMKMENELLAEGPGVVEKVHIEEGEAVEKDQVLVELAPLEEPEPA